MSKNTIPFSKIYNACHEVEVNGVPGGGDYKRLEQFLVSYNLTLEEEERFKVNNTLVWSIINRRMKDGKEGAEVDYDS